MDSSNEDLRAGRTNNALENQERIVQSLERLLNILMDRRGLENLDEEIDELRELRVALSELADEEAQIREETEQLREDSSNEAQQDLEQSLAEAFEAQRELIGRNEERARNSGSFDLEELRLSLIHI